MESVCHNVMVRCSATLQAAYLATFVTFDRKKSLCLSVVPLSTTPTNSPGASRPCRGGDGTYGDRRLYACGLGGGLDGPSPQPPWMFPTKNSPTWVAFVQLQVVDVEFIENL